MSAEPSQDDIFKQLETLLESQSPKDKTVNEFLTHIGTPIISLAILSHGIITSHVLGSSPPTLSPPPPAHISQPYNPSTLFQACSISKPITALAVLKLCQSHILDLDAPSPQYLSPSQLSYISTPTTLPLISSITLRHLLSHTSGLSCNSFSGYLTSTLPTLSQTLRGTFPANHEPVKLIHTPGQQKFYYSGGGFQVIQLILETKFRKPFHEIMHELILQPLGMTRSTYGHLPADETDYAPAYLTGQRKCEPDHHFMPESAAAGLWTTASDLLRAIHAVQKSVKAGDILEREWAREMLAEVGKNGMALGWARSKELNTFSHSGDNFPGYHCFVSGFIDLERADAGNGSGEVESPVPDECGICVMTSSALGTRVLGKIMAAVAVLKGWPSLFKFPTVPFVYYDRQVDGRAVEWCGTWGGKWIVGQDGDGLTLKCGGCPGMRLVSAVIPSQMYEEGQSIDLVADGLEMMLRLGWNDGKRIVEVWQAGVKEIFDRGDGMGIIVTSHYS